MEDKGMWPLALQALQALGSLLTRLREKLSGLTP